MPTYPAYPPRLPPHHGRPGAWRAARCGGLRPPSMMPCISACYGLRRRAGLGAHRGAHPKLTQVLGARRLYVFPWLACGPAGYGPAPT